jgi:hypothetical protein
MEPMMQRDRTLSTSVAILVPVGAVFERPHYWRSTAGVLHTCVRFDTGGYSYGSIQGEPVALRELAAALVEAADQADASGEAPEAVAS